MAFEVKTCIHEIERDSEAAGKVWLQVAVMLRDEFRWEREARLWVE